MSQKRPTGRAALVLGEWMASIRQEWTPIIEAHGTNNPIALMAMLFVPGDGWYFSTPMPEGSTDEDELNHQRALLTAALEVAMFVPSERASGDGTVIG